MSQYDVLFAIMAVQEAEFFGDTARRMRAGGMRVAFLTFHEGGDAIVERMGFDCFSLHKLKAGYLRPYTPAEQRETAERFGIEHPRRLYLHEMLRTNRGGEERHAQKVTAYLRLIDDILREHGIRCVVQELGGFIAPLCLYTAARKGGVPHVFIEPAPFNRRLIFTLDDIYCDLPAPAGADPAATAELHEYVRGYLEQKTVVIPHKDKHSFHAMSLWRVFSFDNFRRLTRKLFHKYVTRKEEEYNAIGWYVMQHLIKWGRSRFLAHLYRRPVAGEPYVFYPFHVPLDVQLTVRCPEYLDQEALVERLAAELPDGHRLYIKEHPAAIGAHPLGKLRRILRNPRVRLIHPQVNSFDLVRNARAVITVNSKVGFEALMQGRPVLVLGRTYYRGKGIAVDAAGSGHLAGDLGKAVEFSPDPAALDLFMRRVWRWSYPGELYEFSDRNMGIFHDSLSRFLGRVFGVAPGARRAADAEFG